MVNSLFCTDGEINGYIEKSYTWLYDLLVSAYGDEYFVQFVDFQAIANQKFYAFDTLPITDFYKIHGVSMMTNIDTEEEVVLKKFPFGERGDFRSLPPEGQWMRLYYVPAPTILNSDSHIIDGVAGWEELIIVDAAIKMKDKEESDTTVLQQERQILVDRIEKMKNSRDAATPDKVTDVRGWSDAEYPDDIYLTERIDYNNGRSVPRYRLRGDGIMFV